MSTIDIEQVYKAWQAIGADIAGLKWEDFAKHLPEQPSGGATLAQQEPVARYKEKCADGARCLHGCLISEACYTSPQPAQPQQEPVAYAVYHRMGGSKSLHWPEQHSPDGDSNEYQLLPLYTSQSQRTWVGLTDEEMDQWIEEEHDVLRWAEATLKEKNT